MWSDKSNNQYPQTAIELAEKIQWVRDGIAEGRSISDLVQALHEEGLSPIKMILVFREATGAGIGDLKRFAEWWSPAQGVTDPTAFDAWAKKVILNTGNNSDEQDQ